MDSEKIAKQKIIIKPDYIQEDKEVEQYYVENPIANLDDLRAMLSNSKWYALLNWFRTI